MPFDGAGNYSPPGPPVFPAITETTISSAYFNQVILDIANNGLNKTFLRDGSVPFTSDVSLGGHKLVSVADPTTLTGAATKNYVDVQDAAAVTALALPAGATTIGYNYGTASSVNRTVAAKAKDIVSIQDWGAVGGDPTNDAVRIQKAFDECPLGETLHFPPTSYTIKNPTTPGTAGLTMSRQINIQGSHTRFVGAFGADVTSNLLNIKIASAAYGAGDVRNTVIRGLTGFFSGGGKDVLYIENQSPMASNIHMHFQDCGFDGGDTGAGYGVHIKGLVTQIHTFEDCALYNTVYLDGCADACRFVKCLIGGMRVGWIVDLASGAFRTLMSHNVVVTRDGAMIVLNGSEIDFLYNQCEQAPYNNANAYFATIAFDIADGGRTLQIKRVNLIGNNFGGSPTYLHNNIFMQTGGFGLGIDDVVIDGNTFGVTTVTDLAIQDSGISTLQWGMQNKPRGNRGGVVITDPPGSASANTLDPMDLFTIVDNGTGTYGIWQDPSKLGLANGWTQSNLRYKKTDQDILVFEGILVAGTITVGTLMATLPTGFRPKNQVIINVGCDNGATADVVVLVVATSGAITIGKLPVVGTLANISMDGFSFRVKGHIKYNPGV